MFLLILACLLSSIMQGCYFCFDIIKQRIRLLKVSFSLQFILIYGSNPQVEAIKKSYHTACKEEKLAASRETNSKLESNNPEAQKKLQEKVEKCQQEVQKVQMCPKAIRFFFSTQSGLEISNRHCA